MLQALIKKYHSVCVRWSNFARTYPFACFFPKHVTADYGVCICMYISSNQSWLLLCNFRSLYSTGNIIINSLYSLICDTNVIAVCLFIYRFLKYDDISYTI